MDTQSVNPKALVDAIAMLKKAGFYVVPMEEVLTFQAGMFVPYRDMGYSEDTPALCAYVADNLSRLLAEQLRSCLKVTSESAYGDYRSGTIFRAQVTTLTPKDHAEHPYRDDVLAALRRGRTEKAPR